METKNLNFIKLFLFIIYYFSLLSLIASQEIEPITIGQVIKGNMPLDESHKYYKLTIPRNESNRVLIISTHEDSSTSKNYKDSFSDPDIYISKKNKYPSSRKSSEWFSEQYGSDILSIPSESVKADDIFYIGMYCEYQCKYYLKVETGVETNVIFNEFYYINLKPKETMSYKIKIKNDFHKLKVMANSVTGGKFKMFMNQNSPSSINTYKVIPSWERGYVIMVKSDSREYCTNCEYHVIIHNDEDEEKSEENQLYFYAVIEDKDYKFNLQPFNKMYDALDDESKVSFTFNITEKEKKEEKLIIDIVVFSGYATLVIEGWRSKNIGNIEDAEKDPNSHNIIMEKYIILEKKDFDKFDEEENYSYGRDSLLHFSLYSKTQISYSIQAYYLTSLNKIPQENVLMPGYKLTGYLLKDQIIAYELFSDNINKVKYKSETNMTITINKIAGTSSAYGYFCKEEECKLNNKNDIEKLEDKNKLLISKRERNPFMSILDIPYSDNYCMSNPMITTEKGNKIRCVTYAIIKCDEPTEDNGLCIFDIQFTIKDTEIIMRQRQVYYGQIYSGKTDRYRITISDINVESIYIVLNSESGDAQLSVYTEDETSYNKESLLKLSTRNDYIPDVVQITKQLTGKDTLVGKYIVNVYPETFSDYQLYYYVLYKKDTYSYYRTNRYKTPEVTMNLNNGKIIMDYFPNDIRYKIYSFTMATSKKENIKVFINRVNINFDIYIYTDISKFEIERLDNLDKDKSLEPIRGYKYKSNSNNEVIIPINDIRVNKMIYIIIAPSEPLLLQDNMKNEETEQRSKEELDKKAVSKFYLGVSTECTPLSLPEIMPHVMTLSNSYSHQLYQKIHSNPNKSLKLYLSILMGEVDIFVSTKYLTHKEIDNIDVKQATYSTLTESYEYDKIIFKLNVNSFTILELDNNFMNTDNKGKIYIYYYIKRSESIVKQNKTCQYMLIEKTAESKGQILQPGVVTSSKIKEGNKAYFIVEEIEKRKWAYINVRFKKGTGNLYLRIPKVPESHNNIRFPNEGNYDYKGAFIYSGRIISIPEKEFLRLDEKKKLQLLITVTAEKGTDTYVPSISGAASDGDTRSREIKSEVEFSISYSNEPKRINQNEPYDGYISQGEFQYFNLYFDKSTENIYIGLTNMNGDADMYLNRGNILPTPEKFHWSSSETGHEYIDIGKDDFFFQNEKKNISGYYTLLIIGFVDTSYSLFVSSHEKKVFPLRDNIPMTCWCENKGEKCFFRYNSVFNNNNVVNGIHHNEVIFTTQYLYGSGYMYSKAMVDSELHNSKDFYKSFPDSFNYEYSNKESNQLNYMKVKVVGEKYIKDSSILLTFECSEKTKVDITSTSLNHFSSVDFIQENRENIYYLGINDISKKIAKLTLIFNNNNGKDQDLIYSVHSYVGDAHIKVYGNNSEWDVQNQKITYNYKLLNEFDLITNDKEQDENIDIYNPYTHDYHNFIAKRDKENYGDIYFYIEPKTEFGFYIQCNFDKNWNKLQIGKAQSFYVVNQELFGYFDITEEYDNVEFSLNVNKNLKLYAELFIKINIIDKNEITQIKKNPEKRKDEFSLYHYSIPSHTNYDYSSVTDKTLGTLSLNLNKLPRLTEKEIEKGNKIIRALFYVSLGNLGFKSIKEVTSSDNTENNNNENIGNNEENEENEQRIPNEGFSQDSNTMVNIYISPGKDNFKYMELKQYEYYFSNLTYNITHPFMKKPIETKVYSLNVERPDHDIMVIEISTCRGFYELNLQEELITKDNLSKRSIEYTTRSEKGKTIIYVEDLKSKHYYLSVRSKTYNFLCRIERLNRGERLDKMNEGCGNDLSYLIYYYTTYSDSLSFEDIDKWVTHRPYGRGRVKLDLPLIITKDIEDNKKDISDYKFDVYATKDKDYTNNMGNICYLSRIELDKNRIFKIENLSIENKNSLIVSDLEPGHTYYINVLVQNLKTKELITFHPIEVFTGGRRPIRWWSLIRNIIIVGLFVFLCVFMYKYRKAREELIFLKGEAVAKTEREFAGMNTGNYNSQGIKYSTLSSGY